MLLFHLLKMSLIIIKHLEFSFNTKYYISFVFDSYSFVAQLTIKEKQLTPQIGIDGSLFLRIVLLVD